jgi:Acetyltransferases
MSITLKRLGPQDAAVFARIAPDVFDEPVVPERIAAYLAEPGHLMILAFDGDLVVGQCAAVIHKHPDKVDELYVDEVGVATSHHRRGIARSMLAEMFAWGRERGACEAWVGTEVDNDAANALYRGFAGKRDVFAYYEWDLDEVAERGREIAGGPR